MDREYTVWINNEAVPVTVQQLARDKWQASVDFHGTLYEASGDTADNALERLSLRLRSHPDGPML